MWSRQQLKENAKITQGNCYWQSVLVAFIAAFCLGGSGGSGGDDGHASDYNALLRMPAVIKDQYGNVYTRMNFNYDGTSADYSGDYTVVTIFAEDVNLFSARAGDRYFTW